MDKKFKGVVVPMITPVTATGKIDTDAVGRIMRRFAKNCISPLVLGTTGESSSVSDQDGLMLVEAAVQMRDANNNMAERAGTSFRQQVYAGIVGNEVSRLVRQSNIYSSLGVDAIVATLPSYYILTPEQMRAFYLTLADKVAAPVFMYNIKATTQMSIPLSVAEQLSHHPNIAGLKDSERDEEKMKASIELFRDREDFSFFCGWGAQGANSLKLGADGIVPSTGNIVPEVYCQLYEAIQQGDFEKADKCQALTDQVGAVYQKGRTLGQSLAALKVLMKNANLCGTGMIPPLSKLTKEEEATIVSQFRTIGL